jgi:hypothetical protein
MFELSPPPCPVHDMDVEVERAAEVPPGYICVVGPVDTVRDYIGDAKVPVMRVANLLVAMAPYTDWEDNFEPMSGGAFALGYGFVIDTNEFYHVCLYNEELQQHTQIANHLIPSANLSGSPRTGATCRPRADTGRIAARG